MEIKVLYFGIIADVVGKSSETMKGPKSVGELKKMLFTSFPDLKKMEFQVSVNKVIALDDDKFKKNDEVALLPPFAGG